MYVRMKSDRLDQIATALIRGGKVHRGSYAWEFADRYYRALSEASGKNEEELFAKAYLGATSYFIKQLEEGRNILRDIGQSGEIEEILSIFRNTR